MQRISPFLWFDGQAGEAAKFYTSVFKNSEIKSLTPMSATFTLGGLEFIALNGGPQFKFTPAISFFVACETREELDAAWAKLSEGGMVLMPLATYPFSEKFGWVQDKFGISWQLNLAGQRQEISPFFMFVGEQHGRAGAAMALYLSVFENSSMTSIERYGAGEVEPEGTIKHARFSLSGQSFMAMDSGRGHPFAFTPAISLFIRCETQKEIDYFWEKLCVGGEKGQCGWLKDKFGVSWQIVPPILGDLLNDEDNEKSNRVMQAMLKMDKIEITGLQQAYDGKK